MPSTPGAATVRGGVFVVVVGVVVDRDRGVVGDGGDDGEADRGGVGVRATEQQLRRPWKWRVVWSSASTVNSSGPV